MRPGFCYLGSTPTRVRGRSWAGALRSTQHGNRPENLQVAPNSKKVSLLVWPYLERLPVLILGYPRSRNFSDIGFSATEIDAHGLVKPEIRWAPLSEAPAIFHAHCVRRHTHVSFQLIAAPVFTAGLTWKTRNARLQAASVQDTQTVRMTDGKKPTSCLQFSVMCRAARLAAVLMYGTKYVYSRSRPAGWPARPASRLANRPACRPACRPA